MYDETRVYTTTTTTRQQQYVPPTAVYVDDGPVFSVNLDTGYLRTLPGVLKLIAVALDFLCFICVIVGGPGTYAGVGWATFVCVFGFVITLCLLLAYLFHVVDQFPQVPWIVCEMAYCFAWTIFYFIAGSVLAIASVSHPLAGGWAVAAFFAFLALIVYALDCYLKFLAWKNNEKAVGGYSSGGVFNNNNTRPANNNYYNNNRNNMNSSSSGGPTSYYSSQTPPRQPYPQY